VEGSERLGLWDEVINRIALAWETAATALFTGSHPLGFGYRNPFMMNSTGQTQ